MLACKGCPDGLPVYIIHKFRTCFGLNRKLLRTKQKDQVLGREYFFLFLALFNH